MTKAQVERRLANYLRTHRRNVGLTQREMGHILGHCDDVTVCRHERFCANPSLVVALGYEIVYRVPVSEIFGGLRDEIEEEVEKNLVELEEQLGQRSANDRNANVTARKLMWISERMNSEDESRA